MDCGVEAVGMLNVGPGVGPEAGPQQPLPTGYSPPDTDQAQFEADKRAVYKSVSIHPS